MARTTAAEMSDDDLPDLTTLLSLPAANQRNTGNGLRRSPRKPPQPQLQHASLSQRVPKSYEASTTSFSAKQVQANAVDVSPIQSPTRRRITTSVGALADSQRPEPDRRDTGPPIIEDQDESPKLPLRTILGEIPILPPGRHAEYDVDTQCVVSISASSNNRLSPKNRQPGCLKLSHVDSLLLPLSKMAVASTSEETEDDDIQVLARRRCLRKARLGSGYARTSKFVLKEARCNDDSQDSEGEDEEDEDTDLSGFVVDDVAELSFDDSAESSSDLDGDQRRNQQIANPSPRRRLQRGSPRRRAQLDESDDSDTGSGSGSNKENESAGVDENSLETSMRSMQIGNPHHPNTGNIMNDSAEIEVIDLTSSPAKPESPSFSISSDLDLKPQGNMTFNATGLVKRPSTDKSDSNTFDEEFDAVLKFSPPRVYSPTRKNASIPRPNQVFTSSANTWPSLHDDDKYKGAESSGYTTGNMPAPVTPPRTPTKSKGVLNSPSKLLSPSKKPAIPHSPHRQSVDAFWDLEVINSWNDAYSPKKAPLPSPKKTLSRFQIWDDSEEDVNINDYDADIKDVRENSEDSSSLPSSCSSPTKRHEDGVLSRVTSPTKSTAPRSPIKVKPKNAEKEAASLFAARKEQLAQTLLADLDANVTAGKINALAASTGGVRLVWSKTLRSTAGRANWRRIVTKTSGNPVKDQACSSGSGSGGDGEVKVSHYASIELATKIVDCEARLVSTLAHEFCHLANFMVSGVRDQPHGASFKAWAAKVTTYLRKDGRERGDAVRRAVEVTTKHAYVISYKYVWVCVGREQTDTQKYLGIEGDQGCGGEYGRHSRSIDVEKQRCGRCKGSLVQVKPKPRPGPPSPLKKGKERAVVAKGKGRKKGSDGDLAGLEEALDVVELSG